MKKKEDGVDLLSECLPAPQQKQLTKSQLIPAPDTPITQCPCSFSIDTEEGKAMVIKGMGEPDLTFNDNGICEVAVVHFMIHPIKTTNPDTGEESDATRFVFFDAKGLTFATTSVVVPNRLVALLQLYPPERWKRGLRLIFSQRLSRKTKRIYHDVSVIPETT